MKTITFDYTAKTGDVSQRTLLVVKEPYTMYAGIDVSDKYIDIESAMGFVEEVNKLHDDYLASLTLLQAKYDLVHNYRQFLPGGMSNIIEV
jgi:hypothetical protein